MPDNDLDRAWLLWLDGERPNQYDWAAFQAGWDAAIERGQRCGDGHKLYELSKPFVRAKCDILAVSLPTITIYPDGRIDTVYDARTYRMLAEWDNLWMEARAQYIARYQGLYGK